LVLAADVFTYLQDLRPVLAAVRERLAPGGLVAFTIETHRGGGVVLHEALRFAHGEKHVREAAKAARLDVAVLERASTRTEKGKPVAGLLAVLSRRGAQSRRNTRLASRPVRSASSAVPRP
jgi:predicted TPR repeat methyltransferase